MPVFDPFQPREIVEVPTLANHHQARGDDVDRSPGLPAAGLAEQSCPTCFALPSFLMSEAMAFRAFLPRREACCRQGVDAPTMFTIKTNGGLVEFSYTQQSLQNGIHNSAAFLLVPSVEAECNTRDRCVVRSEIIYHRAGTVGGHQLCPPQFAYLGAVSRRHFSSPLNQCGPLLPHPGVSSAWALVGDFSALQRGVARPAP